jgi:hypothetical protein
MFRRIASVVLWGSLCLALCPREAAALEINCVEASKYKYLYLIFGNDRRKFASYLRVGDAKLPDGETCRAVLISGRMESRKRSQEIGEPLDRDKLLDAVAMNRGWLATAYLASPGGNIGTGLAAALVTRMFWLKSEAPDRPSFTYWPDFIARPATASTGAEPALADAVVPPDLAEGWRTYVRAVEGLAKPTVASGRGRCASACTFSHVSAIERQGVVYVHRGQASPSVSAEKSMREILESLHRSENAIIALYRSMDGGEEFVRLFQSTPAATVNPATAARYPRYISDLLRRRCKGDAEQLRDQEARVRAQIKEASATDRLKAELSELQLTRVTFEQCAAAAQEKERLAQFAKLCPNSTCNRSAIESTLRTKLKELRSPGTSSD